MRPSRFGLAAITVVALTGCANNPHNDVLIFATNTKFGLDIASDPTAGGAPSFTLGYKRAEGAWMPLVINGQHSNALKCSVCNDEGECVAVDDPTLEAFKICAQEEQGPPVNCLRALSRDIKYYGTDGKRVDTYSVFGSFGATGSARGGGEAQLAQFFATGIAAQELAGNTRINEALIAKDADAELVAAERARADAAEKRYLDALEAQGQLEARAPIEATGTAVDALVACWKKDAATAKQAATNLGVQSNIPSALAQSTEATVRSALLSGGFGATYDADLVKVTNSACPKES